MMLPKHGKLTDFEIDIRTRRMMVADWHLKGYAPTPGPLLHERPDCEHDWQDQRDAEGRLLAIEKRCAHCGATARIGR